MTTCSSESSAGAALLRDLQAQGLRLGLEADGRLRVGPLSALSPSLRALIQAHKPALVQTLATAATAALASSQAGQKPDPEDVAEFFEERAGILEHDAGMSRADAEAEALRLTVARFRLHPGEDAGLSLPPSQVLAQILAGLPRPADVPPLRQDRTP
jgi:hypothetical protein